MINNFFLFGSILKNELVGGSYIDILIIVNIPKKHLYRAKLIANIEEKTGLPLVHPFEFHLLTIEELNIWKEIYNLEYENIDNYLKNFSD